MTVDDDESSLGLRAASEKKEWVTPMLTFLPIGQTRTGGIPVGEGFLPAITDDCIDPQDPFCFFPS